MEYDDKISAEREAELYSRIHHETAEAPDIVPEPATTIQYHRSVTKHSINNKMHKKTTKNRKKAINPNPFAIASAINPIIPKRQFTPYTSYLSQIDSKPIDMHNTIPKEQIRKNDSGNISAPINIISSDVGHPSKDHRPNPFNQGFNRAEEKLKRYQSMQARKTRADKIRENIQQSKKSVADEFQQDKNDLSSIPIPDSESDDEVYIYPPEEPTVISSDDDGEEVNVDESVNVSETIESIHDDCNDISVNYDRRLSRHDDPFGGIDTAELNQFVSGNSVVPVIDSSDHFAKPQRANRHSLKRSYEVAETDFAATDVYESESSDLPECNVKDKSQDKVATVLSESECSDVDITKRSKRMRKRKSSGSNRGSDYISSDDADENDVEPEKVYRPYYLFRGEGVYNAITKYSKRKNAQKERNRDVNVEGSDSGSEDSNGNEEEDRGENVDKEQNDIDKEQDNVGNEQENWIVKDQVGEPDDIDIELNNIERCSDDENDVNDENVNDNESNVDKDDANSVRSRRLVVHPKMGLNNEMRAFYNDSWGGETHNAAAIRRAMPRDSYEWPIDSRDLKANYNMLKAIKCHNCRESGHRMQFCPQPRKEMVCYTCGNGGHREARCPHALCLKCGEKTNSYRRGCERCFRMQHIVCKKCRRRGHYARDCPDNWRAYHNTTEHGITPVRLPMPPVKKYCSACAGSGHRADQCYEFKLLLQDDVISSEVRQYEKVYKDDVPPIDNSESTPYSMFENPRQNFKFNWNVNESSDRIYGRFLAATNFKRDSDIPKLSKKIPKLNDSVDETNIEKFVLHPMNAENMSEKPKKTIS